MLTKDLTQKEIGFLITAAKKQLSIAVRYELHPWYHRSDGTEWRQEASNMERLIAKLEALL